MNMLLYSAVCLAIVMAPKQNRKPEYIARVTPTDFFSGELKRLRPHLGFRSAVCFKIKTQGSITLAPHVELWGNGKRIDFKKFGSRTGIESDEITLTLREILNTKGKAMYRVTVGGMRIFSRNFEKSRSDKDVNLSFGPISLQKAIELRPGAHSIVVWAMGEGKPIDLEKPKELESQLRKLPWVMILRLSVEQE